MGHATVNCLADICSKKCDLTIVLIIHVEYVNKIIVVKYCYPIPAIPTNFADTTVANNIKSNDHHKSSSDTHLCLL